MYMNKKDVNELYFSTLVTKSLEPINSDERYFEGYLTVQMKDKQGEITIVDELYKVLPIWMDRGAPISDTHSNRIIGKGINFSRTVYKGKDGEELPAIKITGKIFKNYELDNDIWEKIKSGEYKGLSFGGATRADRTPIAMKDGSVAYALKELEHYEVAVCKDPAVPLALITDYNPLAKAFTGSSERRDKDKLVIKCTKFGCYVNKVNLSEEDTFEGKVRKLQADGKSRESAEKIVGSFVKANPEGGEQHGMTSADEDLIDSETSDPANPNRRKIHDVDERELEANKAWKCPKCDKEFGVAGHSREGERFEHIMSHEKEGKKYADKNLKEIKKYKIMGFEGQKCPLGNCEHKVGDFKNFQDHMNTTHPLKQGEEGDEYDYTFYPKGHQKNKTNVKLTEGGEKVMGEAKEFIARDERGKKIDAYKQFKEVEQESGTDHSDSEGDKHQMYNQNAGKESWVGNGSPYPKIVKTEELPNSKDEQDDISIEHASHNTPTEGSRLGSKGKKSKYYKFMKTLLGDAKIAKDALDPKAKPQDDLLGNPNTALPKNTRVGQKPPKVHDLGDTEEDYGTFEQLGNPFEGSTTRITAQGIKNQNKPRTQTTNPDAKYYKNPKVGRSDDTKPSFDDELKYKSKYYKFMKALLGGVTGNVGFPKKPALPTEESDTERANRINSSRGEKEKPVVEGDAQLTRKGISGSGYGGAIRHAELPYKQDHETAQVTEVKDDKTENKHKLTKLKSGILINILKAL